MLPEPTISKALQTLGMGLVNGDLNGRGIAGGLIDANTLYQAEQQRGYRLALQQRQLDRQDRADKLNEYELLGRMRTRQLAEAATIEKRESIKRLKESNPEFADLIDLDEKAAAKAIAAKTGGGGGPFGGTAMDAQVANLLLRGDPSSDDYLAAYNIAAQPKVQSGPDGSSITIKPDMSAYRLPTRLQQQPAAMPTAQDSATLPLTDNPEQATTASAYAPAGSIQYGEPQSAIIPGLSMQPGSRPTAQDAKAVKDVKGAYSSITDLLKARKKLIDDANDFSVGSKDAENIEQNTKQILLKIKNLEQTGALDQGSVEVIGPALGDPVNRGIEDIFHPIVGARRSITKARGGKELALDQLKSGEQFLQSTLKGQIETRGYKLDSPLGSIFDKTPTTPPKTPKAPMRGMLDDETEVGAEEDDNADVKSLSPVEIQQLADQYQITPEEVKKELGL